MVIAGLPRMQVNGGAERQRLRDLTTSILFFPSQLNGLGENARGQRWKKLNDFMNRLGLYLLRQVSGPLVFFTFALTALVWLTQSLRMLDVVIQQGQTARTFIELSLLVMPSLLGIIMPVAFFCAAIYSLNRMHTDSELVVMWSAGMSRWHIAKPVIALALAVTFVVYSVNLYFMPAGMRAMKDRIFEIRSDLLAFILREGQFTNPIKGLTVYVRELKTNGELQGLLVYDDRDPKKPVIYLAEKGAIVSAPSGPRLLMNQGNVQQVTEENERPTFLTFDQYVLDLEQFSQETNVHIRETSERYLPELLYPDATQAWDKRYWNRLLAEGHNRLASPLYTIVFALIALVALIGGDFSRRGYSRRIGIAVGAAVLVRLSGVGVQSAASDAPILNVLQYGIPVLVAAICIFLLTPFGASIIERAKQIAPQSVGA
jgi:lipopolysaccharide export system permease protein